MFSGRGGRRERGRSRGEESGRRTGRVESDDARREKNEKTTRRIYHAGVRGGAARVRVVPKRDASDLGARRGGGRELGGCRGVAARARAGASRRARDGAARRARRSRGGPRVGRGAHLGVVAERENLAVEGDGLLPKALRVADVAHDDLVEGVLPRVRREVGLDLPGLRHDRASDRVLHVLDVLVDGVDGDSSHRARLGFQRGRGGRERCASSLQERGAESSDARGDGARGAAEGEQRALRESGPASGVCARGDDRRPNATEARKARPAAR